MGMSAYSIPCPFLALSTTTFLRLPSAVPRKATVKSPVEVAVTEVNKVGKVNTWMGSTMTTDNYTGHAVHQILENLVHDDEVVVILRESVDIYWGLVLPIAIGG